MSLNAFLKENAIVADNEKYVASERFIEEVEVETVDGTEIVKRPVEWEIKCISAGEDEALRKEATKRKPMKSGQYITETDYDLYVAKLAVKCTVYPNLNDKELQDSYGVMGAEALLRTMLLPGEYADYVQKVQTFNGFDLSLENMVDEVKN